MSRIAFHRMTILVALLFAGPLVVPDLAHAHGAGWQLEGRRDAATYRFGYTDGSAMAFAEVVVTAPDGKIWQKARTDRSGRFSIATEIDNAAPETEPASTWQIRVNDGMGHVVQVTHQPKPANDSTAMPSPGERDELTGTTALIDMPIWASMVFGLSLLLNLYGVIYYRQQRRKENITPA